MLKEASLSLQIHNTLTKQREKFVPLTPGEVKMYLCGPTVYGLLHVGNFRGPIFFNLVRNWLEYLGYKVTFVYNFTDIDDRIIDRANEEKVESSVISERYIQEFKTDYSRLKLRPHEKNPKVTEFLEPITDMISKLIENKKAYVANDGEVLYSIRSFDGYGKLSGRNPDELQAGARVEVDQKKKDPLDFALWKPSKPGEPSWPSPWTAGRPGWHIECSAMIKGIFGDQIDIHGGGTDLIFPHHENEIAQSEGATLKPFVKYWMHNNMFTFSGSKMSKSLGNIIRAREFMDDYNPEIFKYMVLSVHYRTLADFGDQAIEKAIRELARIYSALNVAEKVLDGYSGAEDKKFTEGVWEKIETALNEDFNTPEAMAAIFDLVRQFNSGVKLGGKPNLAAQGKALAFKMLTKGLGKMMSLFQEPAESFLRTLDDMLLYKMKLQRKDIDELVKERWMFKSEKNFAKADELRGKLTQMGIAVMDTATESTWEVAK